MTDTLTPTDTRTDERTSTGDHERYAHCIRASDPGAAILEASVTGAPLKALCGKRWVPQRDPSKFPVCPSCREIRYAMQGVTP